MENSYIVIKHLLKNNLLQKFRSKLVPVSSFKHLQVPATDIKNIFFFSLLAFIGYPTHHSKFVAFQTPITPIMEGIVDLHHDIMFFLTFIIIFVLYLLVVSMFIFSQDNNQHLYGYAGDNITHNTPIEIIWTIIPTIILLFIALPSFILLYSMDEQFDPAVTLKVIGRQ